MRDFNKINPSLWGSQKFKKLGRDEKLIYFYFLTCPQTNAAGCFRVPVDYMAADIRIDAEALRKGIERVTSSGLIEYDFDEETVIISQWFRFNPPANPNHALKIMGDIRRIPNASFRIGAMSALRDFVSDHNEMTEKPWHIIKNIEENLKAFGRVSKAYPKGLASPAYRDRDSDRDGDSIKDSPLPPSGEEPFSAADAAGEGDSRSVNMPALAQKRAVDASNSFLMPDGTFADFDALTERLWAHYPAIRDKGHKGKAKEEIRKQLKKGVSHDEIIEGVRRYRRYCDATGEKQPDFWRWIRDDGFKRTYEFSEEPPKRSGGPAKSRGYDPDEALRLALSDPIGRGRAEQIARDQLDSGMPDPDNV